MNAASVTCMVVVVASAAGVLAGAPPELASTLALAKSSACKQAAALIEQGDYHSALGTLQSAQSGVFPWQIEVTNGYQNGFFLNALMGYCLEKADDPPKAYRAYQNSRAYIDEDKSIATPEPRLDVYVGIGRTCNAVGRYTDSFTWLDAARYEGAGDSNIVMAADRALARRAIDIGDYYDAITNLEDLASVTVLTREEYKQLAQLYFWVDLDRKGFRCLIAGLSLLGIDNDLGVKDPLVECLLNNIMRTEADEPQMLFDILGNAIACARSLKGDEGYIISLTLLRSLLSMTYSMPCSDDGSLIRRRIQEVVNQCQHGRRTSADSANRRAKIPESGLPSERGTDSRDTSVPSVKIEDKLMEADWSLRSGRPNAALHCYRSASALLTSSVMQCVTYDGLPASRAIEIGTQMTELRISAVSGKRQPTEKPISLPLVSTLREAELGLTAKQHSEDPWSYDLFTSISQHVPLANSHVLSYLETAAVRESRRTNAADVCVIAEEYHRRRRALPLSLTRLWISALASRYNCEGTAVVAYEALNTMERPAVRGQCLQLLISTLSWLPTPLLQGLDRKVMSSAFASHLNLGTPGYSDLSKAADFCRESLAPEKRAREVSLSGDFSAQCSFFKEYAPPVAQPRHDLIRSRLLLEQGMTNDALLCVSNAIAARRAIAGLMWSGTYTDAPEYSDFQASAKPEWSTSSNE